MPPNCQKSSDPAPLSSSSKLGSAEPQLGSNGVIQRNTGKLEKLRTFYLPLAHPPSNILPMTTESNLWSSSPSQFINFNKFLLGLIVSAVIITAACYTTNYVLYGLILPVGWSLWQYLVVRCLRYELTSERIRLRTGVINQQVNEIELYRIKDTTIQLPFLLRLIKLGTLALVTSDRTLPELELKAIRNVRGVRDMLRENVERLRDLKRVREVDFEGGDDDFEDLDTL